MRTTRRARQTAALLTIGLALAACTSESKPTVTGSPSDTPIGTPTTSNTAGADTPPELAAFYHQTLDWQGCEAGAECADLVVPLDYAKPSGPTLKIKVLRHHATGTKQGSLLVNPGGPGGSGVDYAMRADTIVGQPVRRSFDIVGFDPRGVGKSQPLICLDDKDVDAMLGSDPTPDSQEEIEKMADAGRQLGVACQQRAGDLTNHVSTVEAAKDMDILRAVLGDKKINFLGKSYGTFLGATYAEQFPQRVGKMVLDGVIAPDLTNSEVNRGQAEGFEIALKAYLADCVKRGDCPLGKTVEEGQAWIQGFLRDLDAKPIKSGDESAPLLTEGWAVLGIALPLYDSQGWGQLTRALEDAKKGDGTILMRFANMYADRKVGGGYSGNIMQVISAVNCLDRPETRDLGTIAKDVEAFRETAPTWAPMMAYGSAVCINWPAKTTATPHKIEAQGTDTIVVVGTTRDPATPYAWAPRLRDQLSNAALITYDGDGHTAYTRSNSCVDNAINDYYTSGKAPKDGLTC